MNNPLDRRMFRQAGMSKQPMGILASSPELMTTAQKAMMNNQPIKAQSAVSVNTNPANINSPLVNYFRKNPPLQTITNFASDTADKFMNNNKIIADMINKGLLIGSPDGKRDDTPTIMGSTLPEVKAAGENFSKDKANALAIKKNDSEFMKDIKKIGSSIDTSIDSTIKNIDKGLDYFRGKKEIETADDLRLKGIQKDLNIKADADENRQNKGTFGFSSELEPTKDGSPGGLVDPNVLSPDDPRFPEAFPMAKPAEVAGLSVIDKIKEDAKNPKGNTTKGSDEALGIANLSFKDRVKARRDIISAALGRDVAEKDVRTDVNYNLIMTGLLVAAGESPNAMTNIAKGLAAGLAGYGKAAGESAEAKRKEEIAIGLAAVEQEFKSDEAQKARDKMPDSIRALEIYKKRPDLLEIALQLKKKGKTRQEIATAIAAKAAGSSSMIPLTNEEMNRYVDFAMSGGAPSSSNTVVSIPNSIRIDFNGEDSSGRVGDIVPYRGQSYEIGKNGIATLVTKK